MTDSFMVTLDRTYYKAKPDRRETSFIMERLKDAGGTAITPARFCEHVRRGGTWVPGVFETGARDEHGKTIWGAFQSLQVVAVDIDNAIEEKDAQGRKHKRMLLPGEAGYLTVPNALRLCELRGLSPMCVYTTFSHTDAWPRFRLVFDLGEPITDEETARAIIQQVLTAFNAAGDAKCSNPNRLFFGSTAHGVKESWRVSDDEE